MREGREEQVLKPLTFHIVIELVFWIFVFFSLSLSSYVMYDDMMLMLLMIMAIRQHDDDDDDIYYDEMT